MVQLLRRVPLLDHDRGVQQRRAGEPGHERGVLDRVPEPPAAPAELVVRPVAAERDAEAEATPGGERPGPHPARPAGVDPPLDQSGDRKGIGHREADVARVEHRRVSGQRRVLEDRVEALAIERRWVEPEERVRGKQHEGEKADPDQRLDAQHPRSERRRQIAPEQGDAGAVEREDPDPQHQRALVVAPGGRDLVDQRIARVGVVGDQADREVGDRERVDQRAEGERDEDELAERRGPRERHQGDVAPGGAPERQSALDQREANRQDQSIVADLRDHFGRFS